MLLQPQTDTDDQRERAINHKHLAVKAQHKIAEEKRGERNDKSKPPVVEHGAAEQRHRRHRGHVGRMWDEPRRSGSQNHENDEGRSRLQHGLVLPFLLSGTRSQNRNDSRHTISPIEYLTGVLKFGPSNTKV